MKAPCSGKFVVRVPSELHTKLKRLSASRGISLNTLCVEALSRQVDPAAQLDGVWKSTIEEIQNRLEMPIVGIVLFGSTARGEARSGSDQDLLIVLDEDVRVSRELYRIWEEKVGPHLDSAISPHFVTSTHASDDPGSLWLEVALDGIVLMDSHGAIEAVLRQVRRRIAAGEFVRKISHGHPYWVRANQRAS